MKTALKPQQVTKQEAVVLVKNMLRICISTICYMRNVFEPDCFKNKPYGTISIHQLQGGERLPSGELTVAHKEAFLLTQWLERGVFKALEEEYLRSIIFAIYTKLPQQESDTVLETYEFKIDYQESTGLPTVNNVELQSKEAVKQQAVNFIRSLTEFSSTLDALPQRRWITIQLKYRDHAPVDFEPEYFTATSSTLLENKSFPLVINIANLSVEKFQLKLRFAGLDHFLFNDSSSSVDQSNSLLVGKSGADLIVEAPEKPTASILDRVREHILSKNHADVRSCAKFMGVKESVVREAFAELLKEGVLLREKNKYIISLDRHDSEMAAETAADNEMQSQASMPSEILGKRGRKYSTIKDPILTDLVAMKRSRS